MSDIRQKIGQALIKTKLGLTTREIADELNVKPNIIVLNLNNMSNDELVEKGEYLEGEGQVWIITEKGTVEFGGKNETVKTPVTKDDENPATVAKKSVKNTTFKPTYVKSMKITDEVPPMPMSKMKPEIGTFEIHQIMEQAAVELAKLFEKKPKRVILNRENKIKTLMTLSELGNNSISAILNDIISDLQAA